jgi:hypothetical protein
MELLSPHGSQITTTTNAGTGNAMIWRESDARLLLEFFFFVDLGIGSWSAAWASRVDVVRAFRLCFIRSRILLFCMVFAMY